jgi:hypothetical protein
MFTFLTNEIRTNRVILLNSENGRVSGIYYREVYRLADGRYVQVTCDSSQNDRVVEYHISKGRARKWHVSND